MRKLIYGINLSLDGCCDHTKFSGGAEMLTYWGEQLKDVDLFIYGRTTYELMVPYWPNAAKNQNLSKEEREYGVAFDAIDRAVFSTTLQSVDIKSKLLHNNLAEEVLKLKQQPGKTISTGGVTLPAQLLEAGLVDEFLIVIHPVIVGQGRRLFADAKLPENLGLRLVDTTKLPSGAVALRYLKD